ncbi:unnamed protein product, partial [marine sediment metagenome]
GVLLILGGGSMRSKGVQMVVWDLMLALAFPVGVTLVMALIFVLRVG